MTLAPATQHSRDLFLFLADSWTRLRSPSRVSDAEALQFAPGEQSVRFAALCARAPTRAPHFLYPLAPQ